MWRTIAVALAGVLVGIWARRERPALEPAGDVRGAVPRGGGPARRVA